VTNMETDPFREAMACDDPDEAIQLLWERVPAEMCKNGHHIENNIRNRKRPIHEQKRYAGPYPPEFYPPDDWNPDTHALLIVGPPLLFDEISMLDAHPEQSKEITDIENGGTIKMRYKPVIIPPGIKRVFLHNIEHPFRNPDGAVYGRRVVTHVLNGPCAEAARAAIAAAKAASHADKAASHAATAATHVENAVRQIADQLRENDGAVAHGDMEHAITHAPLRWPPLRRKGPLAAEWRLSTDGASAGEISCNRPQGVR